MTARILPLPLDTAARDERNLLALYAEVDALKARLRVKEREIAPLQVKVARANGYYGAITRESLERALRRKGQ